MIRTAIFEHVENLLVEALETEFGKTKVYAAALECVRDPGLKAAWEQALKGTTGHIGTLIALDRLGVSASTQTVARLVVGHLGAALVTAIHMAHDADPPSAERVAAECIVLAETQQYVRWHVVEMLIERVIGSTRETLETTFDQLKKSENGSIHQSIDWVRQAATEMIGRAEGGSLMPPVTRGDSPFHGSLSA